jgi:hypothetical protein
MEMKNLNAALAKAQAEIKGAKKSAENPFFKSNYADLAECLEAIQGPAGKNGLSVIFDFKTEFAGENPANYIRYFLKHESGEQFESQWLLMFMKDKTPQGFGASCTYYRRQLLKSIYQVPELDDDGNSQSQQFSPSPMQQQRPPVKNYAPQSRS